ncbi:tRNA epoxyqueuosine(34) reductase QueG [Psychrobacter sanguinis]|uniref:tRNA epoxyqueuosine(34) reductase QueG n=1 Tax=Psychrobacter sanguinis TaxID=861445 RepID=UPI00020C9393|nr:tRNA epoxyqueuosine(34) reductase QueG [Psychrobacter sanguinis]EGK14394.1 iron-sulfur cluster-binding protein [Psychrobacter sp. 1501(2011)]MCD9150759.1 tRNA epoxyqueuosine(34) reductase QueG [Psychrobacter sanguinis]
MPASIDSNSAHTPPLALNPFNDAQDVKDWIREQALALGFADCGFIGVNHPVFAAQMQGLRDWLAAGHYGQLKFMELNHDKRANPGLLVEGSRTILSVRMDYLEAAPKPRRIEDNHRPNHAIIARYARGRDYHKTMRSRLKQLAQKIETMLPQWQHLDVNADQPFVFRPFSDSAPIFERPLADAAGLGWTGKHTLLINKQSGSFFVLGELFLSLELPDDKPVTPHCGSCSACIDICPTKAIIGPYKLKADACISYLTIEHDGVIEEKYRKAIGNRVFGCDDCQLICPWNRYANLSPIDDFLARYNLDNSLLIELWQWSEAMFLDKTQGSPLRRTGYVNFLRNLAIGIGNAPYTADNITALESRLGTLGDVLDEHIHWAIAEQQAKAN